MEQELDHREEEPKIEVDSLSLWIDHRQVLRDLSFRVPDRKITALIGPSGSGKSVLLKTMSRLLEEQTDFRVEGDILIDGQSCFRPMNRELIREHRRRFCYISQNPTAFPMSIFDNLALVARYWYPGVSDRELDLAIEQVLRAISLWDEVKDRLSDPAKHLSTGQLQRLAIARSLIVGPEVLLLDEPCAHLDVISMARLEESFWEIKGSHTVFLVSHNLQQASRVSDYTLFLYLGEVIEMGDTDHLFINPRKKQTEDFITGRFG